MGKTLTANQKKTLVEVFPFRNALSPNDVVKFLGLNALKDYHPYFSMDNGRAKLLFDCYKKDPKSVRSVIPKDSMVAHVYNESFESCYKSLATKEEKKKLALTFFSKNEIVERGMFGIDEFSWNKNEIKQGAFYNLKNQIVDWYLRDKAAVKPLLKQMKEFGERFSGGLDTTKAFKKLKTQKEKVEFLKDFGLCHFNYKTCKKHFDLFEYMNNIHKHVSPSRKYESALDDAASEEALKLYKKDRKAFLKKVQPRRFCFSGTITKKYFMELKTFEEKKEFLSHFFVYYDSVPLPSLLHVNEDGRVVSVLSKGDCYMWMMDRILYASNLTSFRLKDFLEDNSRTSLNNIGCQDILYYIENNDDVKSFILQFELRNVSISDVLFCVPSNLLNKVCGKFTYKYVSEVIDYFAKDKSLSKKKFWKTSKYIGDTIDCKYMKVLKTKKEKTEFVRAVGLYNFKLTQVFNHIDCNELFTLEYFKNACKQSGSTDFKEYQKNEMWRVHKFFSTKNEVRAIINLYEKHPEYVKKMIHESLCGFRKDTVKEYADKIQDERTKNEFLFTFMPTQAVPAKWREFLDTREDGYEFNFYETCGLIYACIEHPDEFKENVKGRNFVFDEHATVSFDDVFEK